MYTILIEVFNALYYIFPAYCANGAPVLFGGGKTIDGGRKFFDGEPLFGSHKTYRGFIFGVIIGTFVGWVQEVFAPNVGLPKGNLFIGFALSLGALIGDLLGSFLKRRLKYKSGASFPISDQIDFVLIAFAFASMIRIPPVTYILIILILTIPIHLLVNVMAYLLRLKKNPW
jgi:CDP-2,3-bis-(O-geranylgeranyl)-sn-glycerol synthase